MLCVHELYSYITDFEVHIAETRKWNMRKRTLHVGTTAPALIRSLGSVAIATHKLHIYVVNHVCFGRLWGKPHNGKQRKMWGKKVDDVFEALLLDKELLDNIERGNSLSKSFLVCADECIW